MQQHTEKKTHTKGEIRPHSEEIIGKSSRRLSNSQRVVCEQDLAGGLVA